MTSVVPPRTRTDVAEEFFDALARADEPHAVAVALGELDAGRPAGQVLVGLVGDAQRRVGALWHAGAWSVAQEHAATCINERVVGAVGARTRVPADRGHVVLACLDGEWHALPARIVAEALRLHGWRVTFLGASVPAAHLISFLHLHGPDVVALSCALPVHLPAAHQAVTAAQRTGTPVLAGGPGFGPGGRWARRLGVDAYAPDVAEAAALLAAQPWTPPPAPDGASGPGPEYAGLRERRARLVGSAVARIGGDSPLRGDDPPADPLSAGAALDTTPDEDVAQIVDFLAAAAYLDDPELFTAYLRWLRAALDARGVAPAALGAVLADLRAGLHDFPFAQARLADGAALMTGPGR